MRSHSRAGSLAVHWFETEKRLQIGAVAEAADSGAHLRRLSRVQDVRPARQHLSAAAAAPDPGGTPLDGVLPTEDTEVLGVLADLDLLHLLTQRSTIPQAV